MRGHGRHTSRIIFSPCGSLTKFLRKERVFVFFSIAESLIELHSDVCIVFGSVWVSEQVGPRVGVSATTSTQALSSSADG